MGCDSFSGFLDLNWSQSVFLIGIICRFDFHFPKGNDIRSNNDADVLAIGSELQPVAKILTGGGYC